MEIDPTYNDDDVSPTNTTENQNVHANHMLLRLREDTDGFVVEIPNCSTRCPSSRQQPSRNRSTNIHSDVDDNHHDRLLHTQQHGHCAHRSCPYPNDDAYCIKRFSWTLLYPESFPKEYWIPTVKEFYPNSIPRSMTTTTNTISILVQSILTTLQAIADSVCYRYYPKCEIL
jgi:hypothetical protein